LPFRYDAASIRDEELPPTRLGHEISPAASIVRALVTTQIVSYPMRQSSEEAAAACYLQSKGAVESQRRAPPEVCDDAKRTASTARYVELLTSREPGRKA
jgi:hypothetical protein